MSAGVLVAVHYFVQRKGCSVAAAFAVVAARVGQHFEDDQTQMREIVVGCFAVGELREGFGRKVMEYTAADFVEAAVDLLYQMETQRTVLDDYHLKPLEAVAYSHALWEIAADILESRKEKETAAVLLVALLDCDIFVVGHMDSLGNWY